jgi:glycosyltransferase involved in cell wall biosynthesis
MNILVCAYACRPDAGSEWHVGWSTVESLAKTHELCVLTHIFNRTDIEKKLSTWPLKDRVRFVYFGKLIHWHENRLIARMQDWLELKRWTKKATQAARLIINEDKFDLGIHSTIATWRVASPLAGLGLPWIWGPVGGGVDFPRSFLPILSPTARAFEVSRIVANFFGKRSSALKRCAQDASLVFVNTPETRDIIRHLGANISRIKNLSQTFLTDDRLRALEPNDKKWPNLGDRLQIVAGGTLEGLKGVSLALQALAWCKSQGFDFRYRYLGRGSEMCHLRDLADNLGIGEQVQFGEWLEGTDYIHALQQAHLYLLPSLREGVPVTLVEAMAAGCVPIVADCGGPALVVDDTSGVRVPITTPTEMIDRLAMNVMELSKDSNKLALMSQSGISRIKTYYSKENYHASLTAALNEVAGAKR